MSFREQRVRLRRMGLWVVIEDAMLSPPAAVRPPCHSEFAAGRTKNLSRLADLAAHPGKDSALRYNISGAKFSPLARGRVRGGHPEYILSRALRDRRAGESSRILSQTLNANKETLVFLSLPSSAGEG